MCYDPSCATGEKKNKNHTPKDTKTESPHPDIDLSHYSTGDSSATFHNFTGKISQALKSSLKFHVYFDF